MSSTDVHTPLQRHSQNEQSNLPTFTSIHDRASRQFSLAESSNAGSSRSAPRTSQTRSEDGSNPRDSPGPREDDMEADNIAQTVNGSLGRSKRASGGFLLGSSPNSLRFLNPINVRKRRKGKYADGSLLSVPKRAVGLDGQENDATRRSSPLSSEVLSHIQANDTGSTTSRDRRSGQINANHSQGYDGSSTSGYNPSTFGFDTDPAQIVEMALRLNEGRRRQAAEKRFFSSDSQSSRRIISSATNAQFRARTPTETTEQSGRISSSASKRKSLNAEPITPAKPDSELLTTETISPPFSNNTSPELNKTADQDEMRISRTTQKRIDKAKEYFELAYQHRRLLPHLPPLRRPDTTGSESRVYNPLQYVRNRKLRFRERAAINSEVDGWHEVAKVTPWVDAVISSHTETQHDPLECIRLPPLSMREIPEDESDQDSNPAERKAVQSTKPRRPKSDWVTHPGDLIADAFWTEQGLNKHKIYDRDNIPIYPPGTQFHFSGWRNRTPISVPEALQKSPSSPQEDSPTALAKEAISSPLDLPTFEPAHKDRQWVRRKSKLTKPRVSSAILTKKNERGIFDTSSSESDDQGDREKESRGRKRLPQRRHDLKLIDGDPFAPSVRTVGGTADFGRSVKGSSVDSPRHSTDRSGIFRHLHGSSNDLATEEHDNDVQKKTNRRKFLHSLNLNHEVDNKGRSSFDDDNSTAPGTPNGYGFPSIAISLSPPGSRNQSPMKKGKGSLFDIVKEKVHHSRDRVDRNDFADQSPNRGSRDHSSASRSKKMSFDWSRGPSPMGRGPSPFSRQRTNLSVDESAYPEILEQRNSAVSKVSAKTNDSWPQKHHRVRGMFKGGRIAELVGNEVSKVGDFIWKREAPVHRPVVEDSGSGYESDSDEMLDPVERPQKSPTLERTKTSSSLTSARNIAPVSPPSKSPPSKSSPQDIRQYHIQGLPSFTSPFQRDREETEKKKLPQSPGGTPQMDQDDDDEIDPISTAAARRRAGKDSRLDRLAPPRLDMKSVTPDGRRNSYGFGSALDLSRTKSASQLFNSAINDHPRDSHGRKPAMGTLAVPDLHSTDQDLSRTSSNQDPNGKPKKVTIHDFVRTRALLLSTAVKATNIMAYCDAIPKPQSAFVFTAFHSTNVSGSEINQRLPVPRKDEHVLAAQHLIDHLSVQSNDLNNHLNEFTKHTTSDLHRQIQILEDRTESSLFPRLSHLSDQAGQLAQKLTTTSTLAVKGVNDEVTEAIRLKRRGPFRWSSLLGYKLAEIGVVGLLWVVWFIVTTIRFAVAVFRVTWAVIAWLLFLR